MSQAADNRLPDLETAAPTATEFADPAPVVTSEGQEVTMSGDLEQISLTDIFQTLAMSKMTGVLKVSHPLEQRTLFFQDGFVKDLVFGRAETRRIGERLLHAGLVEVDDLREALQEQRDTGKPLGQILTEAGLVEAQAIDDIAKYQAAEDLYTLFTWKHGTFEFYKGPPKDLDALARLQVVPAFDVNSIMLEVARRSDEWDLILAALGSMDEILLATESCNTEELSGDHAAVMAALDGTRSVRELTDVTLLGLFDCARALKDLHEWQMVEHARPDELLAIAEMQRLRGDTRRAVVTLRTLVERNESLDVNTTRELAAAMERCGETRLASQCLWRKAKECEGSDQALDLAREACRLDKRSSFVLEYLQDLLVQHHIEGEELVRVTSDLADALVEEGREDAALTAMERLQEMEADLTSVLSRKARLLQRLGKIPEAVHELVRLTEILKKDKRHAELAKVYEQILMLDYRRRDIAKALAALRTSKRARRVRVVGLVVLIAGLGYAALHYLEAAGREDRLQEMVHLLRGKIADSAFDELPDLIAQAREMFGERPEIIEIDGEVQRLRAERQRQIAESRQNVLRKRLALAANNLDAGHIGAALDLYRELATGEPEQAEVLSVARGRVGTLPPMLERLATELPSALPPPAKATQTPAERSAVLAQLDRTFKASDLAFARGVLEARRHPLLAELLGKEAHERVVALAETVEQTFAEAQELRRGYVEAAKRAATEEQLQPVFVAAREHEARMEFAPALQAYKRLVEEYPAEDELKAEFRAKVQSLSLVIGYLDAIAEATDQGDFERAMDGFAVLKQAFPTMSFERLVRLPLRVESLPRGATVWINGKDSGVTPLQTSFAPVDKTAVRVHLRGFSIEEAQLEGIGTGQLSFALAKEPDWVNRAPGAVERRPLCSDDGLVYVVDRSGGITALDLGSGDVKWTRATGDDSGLLPTPLLYQDQLVVGSFDGTLRALDRQTGDIRWEQPNTPCEGAPVKVGSVVVAGTRDGHAVGFTHRQGEGWSELYRVPLPGPVEFDLATDGEHAFVATRTGTVLCLAAADGAVVWQYQASSRIAAALCVAPSAVVAVCDDGTAVALDARTGKPRWQLERLGELTLPPALVGDSVVIASDRALRRCSLADGAAQALEVGAQVWSSPPTLAAGHLLIGDRSGVLHVLDPNTLARRYEIRGSSRLSAAPACDPRGRTVVAFEDKVVKGFAALP